jgi:S-adenosylmethionine:tRNA ribosyltransferase-isomerase
MLVPRVGIEPTRCHHHRILSPARLPVPPPRRQAQYNKPVFIMHISDFDYDFDESLIALRPLKERSASRLLCLDGNTQQIHHGQFKGIVDQLLPGDLLVFNDTKVIPARLYAKKSTGGQVELLVTEIVDRDHAKAWLRSSKPIKLGARLFFEHEMVAEVLDKQGDEFLLRFENIESVESILEAIGHMPLPPYIDRPDEAIDYVRYQTVYAKQQGAIAAPTAGLHFDESLLQTLVEKGVQSAYVTLHVGVGTFQPVRVDDVESHQMHEETVEVCASTCQKIAETKARGGRVIAVGTTTVRSLEMAARNGSLQPFSGRTSLFIYPEFQFQVIDALITNLHLPRSTLLMLVCAFAGRETVLAAYREAVQCRYRFFSYGDAMFIMRKNRPS